MKSYTLIAFVFVVCNMLAEDLVLNLQATIQENTTHLDSIKVENTENDSKFVLKSLSLQSTYALNVDQQSVDVVTMGKSLDQNYYVRVNRAGLIGMNLNDFLPATIHVYNITGQLQYSMSMVQSGNVQVDLPGNQVYVVSVRGNGQAFTTKALGSSGVGSFGFSYVENFREVPFKSASLNSAALFNYTPGDTLKVVVYKGGYFANPKYVVANVSQNLDFMFFHADSCMVDYEENVYPAVQIDDQMWITENLRSTKFIDGTPIPQLKTNTQWTTDTMGFCWYNNDSIANAFVHGALYKDAGDIKHLLCPDGWHLPSGFELLYLFDNTIMRYDSAGIVALCSADEWATPVNYFFSGSPGNNSYPTYRNLTGFSAKGNGFRLFNGNFSSIQQGTSYWVYEPDGILSVNLDYENPSYSISYWAIATGYSIRLIKNKVPYLFSEGFAQTDLGINQAFFGRVLDNGKGERITLDVRGCEFSQDSTFTSGVSELTTTAVGDFGTSIDFIIPLPIHVDSTFFVRAFADNEYGRGYGKTLRYEKDEVQLPE